VRRCHAAELRRAGWSLTVGPTTTSVHKTLEGRDGHLAGGRMEAGMTDGYSRLDELLAALQGGAAAEAAR
jgi:hypothetical protein